MKPALTPALAAYQPEPADEVLLQVHQRRKARERPAFDVRTLPDGGQEIPMAVRATTVGCRVPRRVPSPSPAMFGVEHPCTRQHVVPGVT